MKNIRNNWLTEKTGELHFERSDGIEKTATWNNLIELYEEEQKSRLNLSGTRGLSSLDDVAVRPKPIERQNVSTCLKVFSEQTYTAIMSHPSFQNRDDFKETGEFIRSVKDMWSILNVRKKQIQRRTAS